MSRLRYNFQHGTISSVNSSATALSSAEFANLPAVTGSDYLALSLESQGVDPEIVYVTAHTASATTVTVSRGQEGSTAAAHADGTTWQHAPTVLDFRREAAQYLKFRAISGSYTLVADDGTLQCTGTTTLTLPAVATIDPDGYGGHEYTIIAGAVPVTINSVGLGFWGPDGSLRTSYVISTPSIVKVVQVSFGWIITYDSNIPYVQYHAVTQNTVTGNYTLVLTDAGKVVEANSTSPIVITIPPVASVAWPTGTIIELYRLNTGSVTVAGPSVTINSPGSLLSIAPRYGSAVLRYRGSDVWTLEGRLT